MMNVKVFKIPMDAPDDISGLQEIVESKQARAEDVVAIIMKTEGNGRVNDFTRGYAIHVFKEYLAKATGVSEEEIENKVALVGSGGCEGVMSPHATVLVREEVHVKPTGQKRLAVGVSFTRKLLPEEIGTMAQVEAVAEAVKKAMEDADIRDAEDVHYVQVKCPLLTSERINDARCRGKSVKTIDTVKSLGFSNGASGLGIALGLGEVSRSQLSEEVICTREDLYPTRGASSAGVELMNCAVILLGNSTESVSDLRIGHSVMRDFIDADAVRKALRDAGLSFECCPSKKDLERVVQVFAKGLVASDGRVRGRRTTLLTDSDLGTRPARAVVNAVAASVIGDTAIYVSAGWGYHQGPVGGGIVAAIVRV